MSDSWWTRREALAAAAAFLLAGCGRTASKQPYVYQSANAYYDPDIYLYTVNSGDTLYSISRRSGLSVQSIASANQLHTAKIRPGEIIRLPGVKTPVRTPSHHVRWPTPMKA